MTRRRFLSQVVEQGRADTQTICLPSSVTLPQNKNQQANQSSSRPRAESSRFDGSRRHPFPRQLSKVREWLDNAAGSEDDPIPGRSLLTGTHLIIHSITFPVRNISNRFKPLMSGPPRSSTPGFATVRYHASDSSRNSPVTDEDQDYHHSADREIEEIVEIRGRGFRELLCKFKLQYRDNGIGTRSGSTSQTRMLVGVIPLAPPQSPLTSRGQGPQPRLSQNVKGRHLRLLHLAYLLRDPPRPFEATNTQDNWLACDVLQHDLAVPRMFKDRAISSRFNHPASVIRQFHKGHAATRRGMPGIKSSTRNARCETRHTDRSRHDNVIFT